jgi:hypothetical protein
MFKTFKNESEIPGVEVSLPCRIWFVESSGRATSDSGDKVPPALTQADMG